MCVLEVLLALCMICLLVMLWIKGPVPKTQSQIESRCWQQSKGFKWTTVHGVTKSWTRLAHTYGCEVFICRAPSKKNAHAQKTQTPQWLSGYGFWVFFLFYFIFKLYNIVLVLPNIEMNLPQGRGFRMGNTGYGF